MCEANAAACHEAAADAWTSESSAHSMSAEASATAEACMAAAETAASMATTPAAATRLRDACRSSEDDRRRKCSFDCEC
jgi:hypothetical protein